MNHSGDWNAWNQRLSVLWPDSLKTMAVVGEDGRPPSVVIDGVSLTLAPSHWGLGEEGDDIKRVEEAFETIIQGHAPDYWRESNDPLVQALGWVDRRIGKRSWRHHQEQHGMEARNPLEQQIRALRFHSDQRLEAAAPKSMRMA